MRWQSLLAARCSGASGQGFRRNRRFEEVEEDFNEVGGTLDPEDPCQRNFLAKFLLSL